MDDDNDIDTRFVQFYGVIVGVTSWGCETYTVYSVKPASVSLGTINEIGVSYSFDDA